MPTGSRSAVPLALVLLGGAVTGAAQEGPRITLAEAIERAARVQPSVVQAQGTVRSAQAREHAAFGAFLPSLTLSSSVGDFYSEGARIDPSTGQLTTSGSTHRSVNTSVGASRWW